MVAGALAGFVSGANVGGMTEYSKEMSRYLIVPFFSIIGSGQGLINGYRKYYDNQEKIKNSNR